MSLALRKYWKKKFPYEKLKELKEFVSKMEIDKERLIGYDQNYLDNLNIQEYVDRIEKELDIINTKGYPSYFLSVADYMQYCRNHGIVVNTRGSAGGSLVSYLIGVGILDPLYYGIPFERFLNPLRPSAPDIDGDFADDRRQEVIDYIVKKYGKDQVCQIATFGTMLPRASVRDIGRVLGINYRKCDRISKLIPTAPQGRKTTFSWALETSEELRQAYQTDPETQRIIDIAKKIEGNYRHSSVHAAGLYIAPSKLTNYTPLQWDSDHKMIISQYDWHYGESAGLVKMDILGITNLSILGNALKMVENNYQKHIDLQNLNLRDKKAFELLSKGKTMGLFQLSGAVMTKYLVQLEPNKVQDLMAMVALYRPGPMANIPDYIRRKKNPRLITYLHPRMEEWMKESYGILVYQEDVLYTVLNLAGYDWGEADKFRKAMGKKDPAVLAEQRAKFTDGCLKNGITQEEVDSMWALIEPFSAYGFNKAHSSNYGMVAYWTAFMKANFPAEFMTALMTSEEGDMDKIMAAIVECQDLGVEVLPPDVNKSKGGYSVENPTTIRYGLGSIKGLGSDVISFIVENREKSGEYKDFDNFLDRVSQYAQFNKRSLESLILSGALDSLKIV